MTSDVRPASSEPSGSAPAPAETVTGGEQGSAAPLPAATRIIRSVRAIALMIVVGAAVIVEGINDVLPGIVVAGIFAVVVLAIPTSRQLSRRILLAGCLFFGWVPVLYWWDLPVGDIGRSGVIFAGIAALLAGWVGAAHSPMQRLRLLVPRLRVIDALPMLVGPIAAAMLWKWLQAKSGASAMSMMIPGWDHSAHYSMTHSIRLHGVTTQGLPGVSEVGQASAFDGYPQSFHAAVANVMELLTSATPGSAEAEIALYTRGVGVVLVAAIVMLCAGLCALPHARHRPAAAVPLVLLIGAAFVLGPGGAALQDGFPNFVLASALAAAVPLITVPLGRVLKPLYVAALGGALVGVAHGWAPLLLLAVPGLFLVLVPLRRRRWTAKRSTILLCAVPIIATVAAVSWAALILVDVPLEALVTSGAVSTPDLGLVLFFALACLAVCLMISRTTHAPFRKRLLGPALRTAWLVLLPIIGLIGAVALATYQIATANEVSYYFWKYVSALELVSVVALAIAILGLMDRMQRPRGRRGRTAVAVGALTIAATQVFGYAAPNLPSTETPANAPGTSARTTSEEQILEPPWAANMIYAADGLAARFPDQPIFYISAPEDGLTVPYSMTQWFLGLTDRWTYDTQATVADSQLDEGTIDAASEAVERVLRDSPENIAAVGPDVLDQIRSMVPDRYAERIVAW